MRIPVQWVAGWVLVLAVGQVARADLPPWPPRPQPSEGGQPEPKPLRKPLPSPNQPIRPSTEDAPLPSDESPASREPGRRPASCQPAPRQTGLGLGPVWLLLLVGAGLFASRRRWA